MSERQKRPSTPAPRRRRVALRDAAAPDPDDVVWRQEAGRAIGYALRALRALRGIFIADCLVLLLLMLGHRALGNTDLALAAGVLAVLTGTGAFLVVRQPLPWAVGVALLHTAQELWLLLRGVTGLVHHVSFALMVLLWCVVKVAVTTQGMLREHPDLWIARRLRGEGRDPSTMGSRWRDRAGKASDAALVRMVVIAGGVIVALAAVVWVLRESKPEHGTAPGPGGSTIRLEAPTEALDPRLEAWALAWQRGTLPEIGAFLAADVRERKLSALGRLFRRHDWQERRPGLTLKSRSGPTPAQVAVFWELEGEARTLQTDWQFEKGAWTLLDLTLR